MAADSGVDLAERGGAEPVAANGGAQQPKKHDELLVPAAPAGQRWIERFESWWDSWSIPLPYIPRVYHLMKWSFLVLIAVSTALVGFFQSFLVSLVYMIRTQYFIYRVVQGGIDWRLQVLEYVGVNAALAFACTFTVYFVSPAASGSGIPDVKAFLNGLDHPAFKAFFQFKTFVAKVIASALAVSSSMAVGKEGPMLHAGSILAVILGSNKWMQQEMTRMAHWGLFTYNKELRDLVAVGAACGVTTAFKAPVGGVLFSMELSSRWRKDLTWRCFLAAAITIVVVQSAILICKGVGECYELKYGSLIFFEQAYPAHYEQVWAVGILAIIVGYIACLFTSFNTWVCLVRKRWAKKMWARMLEVVLISIGTSLILYIMPALGSCRACNVLNNANNCIMTNGVNVEFQTFNGYHCKDDVNRYNDLAVLVFNPQGFKLQALFTAPSNYTNGIDSFTIWSLLIYGAIYWFLAAVTYGAFIPSGLFTPSLIMGSCLGRAFAELLIIIGVPGVDVGMYALMGAGAFLGGLMRMSAAMALILMEMTNSPKQLPFLMLVLVLAKQVGDQFNYGVFEHQMMLKGLAFVGIEDMGADKLKKERISAKNVMSTNNRARTLYVIEDASVMQAALDGHPDLGAYPVTTEPEDEDGQGDFLGMISRANVIRAIEENGRDATGISLERYIEVAPIVIPPNMPLPFIYRIVQAEGINYLPVVRNYGPLAGIVSREELVDIQNKKLDDHHLKEMIDQMSQDIEAGKIIGSMHLTDNIHAMRMREGVQNLADGALNFIKNPVKATKDFVMTGDEKKPDDPEAFYYSEFGRSDALAPVPEDGEGGRGDVSIHSRRAPGRSTQASSHASRADLGRSPAGTPLDASVRSGDAHTSARTPVHTSTSHAARGSGSGRGGTTTTALAGADAVLAAERLQEREALLNHAAASHEDSAAAAHEDASASIDSRGAGHTGYGAAPSHHTHGGGQAGHGAGGAAGHGGLSGGGGGEHAAGAGQGEGVVGEIEASERAPLMGPR